MIKRSQGLIAAILIPLVLGVIFAYALPAVSAGDDSDDDGSLREAARFVDLGFDKGWLYDWARLGVVGAAIAAVAFTTQQRMPQAWCVTLGCASVLPFVIYLNSKLKDVDESLAIGSGIWLAMVCFLAAAAVPWIAWYQDQN